jgi:hypothetical protein
MLPTRKAFRHPLTPVYLPEQIQFIRYRKQIARKALSRIRLRPEVLM